LGEYEQNLLETHITNEQNLENTIKTVIGNHAENLIGVDWVIVQVKTFNIY
jgi:hypothetical protein